MALTTVVHGSDQSVINYSIGLFAATWNRQTTLNRLVGKMPTQADAEGKMTNQSTNELPVIRVMDPSKNPGDEVTFDLVQPIGGKPIMGNGMAEGRGDKIDLVADRLRIDQTRKVVNAGSKMDQKRTKHILRNLARPLAMSYMLKLEDQLNLVHLAGARGFAYDIEWSVPLASDADFSSICINSIKAPTRNRHFISTGSGIETVKASGNDITIATTDVLNMDMVDGLKTLLDSMPVPPPPVKYEDDEAANDSPMRVLLVSSEQYTSFVQSTTGGVGFRTLQANAMARAGQAKSLALFRGDAALWNGILIVKMPKPIRFFAGDAINWCASLTSATETTTDCVPDSFSTTHAVDRAILLGGQALVEAYGTAMQSGKPYFWEEREYDFRDKFEVAVGMIGGKSKVRFNINHGNSTQPTDFGVIAIDTAVRLAGV